MWDNKQLSDTEVWYITIYSVEISDIQRGEAELDITSSRLNKSWYTIIRYRIIVLFYTLSQHFSWPGDNNEKLIRNVKFDFKQQRQQSYKLWRNDIINLVHCLCLYWNYNCKILVSHSLFHLVAFSCESTHTHINIQTHTHTHTYTHTNTHSKT